ncbi:MAG: hypothetical protein ABI868_08575 [Acidobacteriota bacterium]
MINYTECMTMLMRDIVARVPRLSFIDLADVLVFARAGRSDADGAFATCHCLTLPPSEAGYYFWRDRTTGRLTRRSEWFVTRSPAVAIEARPLSYMISFALPRFCDQSLDRTRKERFYPGAEPWLAKLDTVVHELYHIDPDRSGIRRIERQDGTYSDNCHGHLFFTQVADMVATYVESGPDPAIYDFLRYDFDTLDDRFGGVAATTFRTFPSYPQRYLERAELQPVCEGDEAAVVVEPLRPNQMPTLYTERDLQLRHFSKKTSRRLPEFRAA